MDIQPDFVFGLNHVIDTLKTNGNFSNILLENKKIHNKELLELIARNKIKRSYVPKQKLNSITQKNHQGVILYISPIKSTDIGELLPNLLKKNISLLFLILTGVTDINNIGAIIRTAVCAGANAIILDNFCGRINSDCMHTSAGSLSMIPICKSQNIPKIINYFKENKIAIIACTEKAEDSIYQTDLTSSTAFIFGSEHKGIPYKILKLVDKMIKIPIKPNTISSLNVSVSTGITLYETMRQRNLNIKK